MGSPRRLVGGLAAGLVAGVVAGPVAGCGVEQMPTAMRDPRLREDCGEFAPSRHLVDAASAFGDPARRAGSLKALGARRAGSHPPVHLERTRHPDPSVADVAWNDVELLCRWNDDFREEVAARGLAAGRATVVPAP